MRLAVMQGRLLPPPDGSIQRFPGARWREEFPLAAAASIDAIEWIYDSDSGADPGPDFGTDANPIATDEGIAEMRRWSVAHGVAVASLCADCFLDLPLVRASEAEVERRMGRLAWLLGRCAQAGIGRVVVPFVDHSRLESEDELAQVAGLMRRALEDSTQTGVELHLETSLAPARFRALLAALPHPRLKVNYDAGNSAALGYDPGEEIAAYGERIGSVHIKDRVRGGGTVPLGTGDACIPTVLGHLFRIGYRGDFVLQLARGETGAELAWIERHREKVAAMCRQAGFTLGNDAGTTTHSVRAVRPPETVPALTAGARL